MNRKTLLFSVFGVLLVVIGVWLVIKPEKETSYDYPEIPVPEYVVSSEEESTMLDESLNSIEGENLTELEFNELDSGYNNQYQGDLNKELYRPKEMELTDNGIRYVRQNIESLGLSVLIPEGYEPIEEQSGGFVIFSDATSKSVLPNQFAVAKFKSQQKGKDSIQMDVRKNIRVNYRYYSPGKMYELMTLNPSDTWNLDEVLDEETSVFLDTNYPADRIQLIDESIGSANLEESHKLLRWTEQITTDQLVIVGGTSPISSINMFINYGVLENDATVVITSTKVDYPEEMEHINRVVAESVALMTDEVYSLPTATTKVESDHFTLDLPEGATLTQTINGLDVYTFPTAEPLSPLSQIQIALYDVETIPDLPTAGDLMNAIPYVDNIAQSLVTDQFSQFAQTSQIVQINAQDFGEIQEEASEVVRYNSVYLARTYNVSDDELGKFKYPMPLSGELLSIYRNESGNVYGILVSGSRETGNIQKEIMNKIQSSLNYD